MFQSCGWLKKGGATTQFSGSGEDGGWRWFGWQLGIRQYGDVEGLGRAKERLHLFEANLL